MIDAPMIGAITGLLLAIGGGFGFVWRKLERRFAKIEAKLDDCEKRDRMNQSRFQWLTLLIQRLVDALHSHDPASPVLADARRALRAAYPIDMDPPADMQAMFGELDKTA